MHVWGKKTDPQSDRILLWVGITFNPRPGGTAAFSRDFLNIIRMGYIPGSGGLPPVRLHLIPQIYGTGIQINSQTFPFLSLRSEPLHVGKTLFFKRQTVSFCRILGENTFTHNFHYKKSPLLLLLERTVSVSFSTNPCKLPTLLFLISSCLLLLRFAYDPYPIKASFIFKVCKAFCEERMFAAFIYY